MALDPDLQKFVDDGSLRHISSRDGWHTYVIDELAYDERGSLGKQRIIFQFSIDDNTTGEGEHPFKYELTKESEHQGGSEVLSTNDAEEVAAWIEQALSDAS